MKKILSMLTMLCITVFAVANIASAHVTVSPDQVPSNSYQEFTFRVPTEKTIPTVKLKVRVPSDVDVSLIEPVPGWKYSLEKNKDGKVTNITWTAEGKGLSSTEFGEFSVMGKVSPKAKKIEWKAYQTYKDGSVVKWIQEAGGDNPAPVTKVVKGGAEGDGHNAVTSDNQGNTAAKDAGSQLPLYLSIAAVIISIIAFIISLAKKKK
ncbi:YcnI family protein [Scopulibacillus cellulosilyticus]|uniref:YcnI family protein n=1 Tax=Scopulibacillus cellulosilyticus TaxID=2665665 RepID=A0ABW2PXD5_9BACL